jgi:hypothetical protein
MGVCPCSKIVGRHEERSECLLVPFAFVCQLLVVVSLLVACLAWLAGCDGCSCWLLVTVAAGGTTTIRNTTGVASATAKKCSMRKLPLSGKFTRKLRVIYHLGNLPRGNLPIISKRALIARQDSSVFLARTPISKIEQQLK